MKISIDFSNMIGESAGGIPESEWANAPDLFSKAHAGFTRLRESGAVGFVDIASDNALRDQSLEFAARAKGRFDDVVVLGIGGSALGPIALRTALRPSAWNMLSAEARGGFPRLQVLDNVDPETIAALLGRIDLARTLFVVTSKSGGTAETMSQYMIVDDRLTAAGLPAADHLVFVTDPAQGALRPLAKARGIPALDIPPNVGGRFSVLTPVGTLPAALIGIDITELLAGAAEMADRCATPELEKIPPASTRFSNGSPILVTERRSTSSCLTPIRCATSPTGSSSSGRRASASTRRTVDPSGLHLCLRWAPRTSTVRFSFSWKARRTRR